MRVFRWKPIFFLAVPFLLIFAGPAQAAAPTISSLSPTSGAVGASVTITGTNFGSTQGTSTVTFNGTSASTTSWGATSIVATVPSGATTGNVVVKVSNKSSNGVSFTVVAAPSITSLSQASGPVGASVTISGSNFGTSQGTGYVKFNGTIASATSWGSGSISVTVPSGATTGNVIVHTSGVDSNGANFSVAPSITSLSTTEAAPGTSITINGLTFGNSQGNSTVTFNGTTASPTSWANTSIAVPVPSGATTGPVVVTVANLASNGVAFTVAPTISSISPTSGAAGTSVTISGLNFGSTQGSSQVTFNGITSTPTSWGLTSIVTSVPQGQTTGQIVVTVAGFTSNGVAFTGAPTISGVSPPSAAAGGSVTISGFNFGYPQGTSTATFNGQAASPSSWGTETVVTPVPAAATSGSVVVTVGGVASNSFSFTVGPGITSLNPTSGVAGTSLTISGSGFGATQGSSTVTFNGVSATPSSWSSTGIVVPVPSGATSGLVLVTVGGVPSNGVSFVVGPNIVALSPTSGAIGSKVTISGTNFGASQGQSTVTFNGFPASPMSWGPTNIVTSVPSGAFTGLVMVTVGGQQSNAVAFTVGTGTVSGTVTRTSDGAAVSGALVEALQSNATQGSATTASDGTYSISNLATGIYDIRVTATGYGTTISAGNNVGAGGPATVNVSLGSAGTISGTITQSDGITPLPGALITALEGVDTAGTATSNSSGSYSISTLAVGSYIVQASATGYKTQSQSDVSVTSGNTTTENFSFSGQSLITYDYDELGRLVGTVDSLSDAVAYNYDAVGNLLAISRNHSNQTSILYFTPQSGLVGTNVTISGTGFSSTPSQNTVKFNGTVATVTSASATQLVAAVPTGATTGAITVSTSNGTANSSTSFTVGSGANGAPTITGFTPATGAPGTAVTISGTNFDVVANDRTKFNVTFAGVTSATSTSISTLVPIAGTSGHLSVATPNGAGVSTGDFFVPPPGYTTDTISFTGRMMMGGTFTGSIGAAGQIGLVVFDGTAGHKVSLLATAVSLTSGSFQINNPNGSALTSVGSLSTSGGYLDGTVLPVTGTYTIFVYNSSAGSLTLNLYDATDLQGTITPGGPSVTINTVPGQNETLSFTGTYGQQVGINLTNGSYSNCILTLYDPNGSTVQTLSCIGATNSMNPVTLAAYGTYQILIDPRGSASGGVTVQVTNLPPVTGTIIVGGPPVTVTTTQQGQDAALTFSAPAGQMVQLSANPTSLSAYVYLVKPDKTYQTFVAISPGSCNPCAWASAQTLATTGTYTLWVEHNGTTPGSATLQLSNVVAATASATVGGSAASVTISLSGYNANITFTGTANQQVTVHITNNSIGPITVSLLDPNFNILTSSSGSGSFNLATQTLITTGTYTIYIHPTNGNTGTVYGSVTSP